MCERILSGGQKGYDSVIPDREELEASQEALKSIRHDKHALKEANRELTKEISQLIEQIVGAQQDLQESLRELASFGDDSPYMPSQTVTHFPTQPQEPVEAKSHQIALSHLETRIAEIESYQRDNTTISGFVLEELTGSNAIVSLNIEKIATELSLDPMAFVQALQGGVLREKSFKITFEWSPTWIITQVKISLASENFQDIVELGVSENSPSFILREISHRVICFAKRFSDIHGLTESKQVVLRPKTNTFDKFVEFGLAALPSIVIRLHIPLEYPQQSVKIIYARDDDGTLIEAVEELKSKKFASIFDALDAISCLL